MNPLNLEKVIELRHRLHRCPELSMHEQNTFRVIRRFLEENTSLEIRDMGSWLYAVKKGSPGGKTIAFRADTDALPISESRRLPYASANPGVAHACGHDGHAAALCALALELEAIPVSNTVCLLFQPGEEIGSGALLCREIIKKENVSEIYAFHNLPGYPEKHIVYRRGLTQPASVGIRFSFHGKTSHASAPEEGCSPAAAIAKTILFSLELPNQFCSGMALCTVAGVQLGNGDIGISPGEGTLSLTIRADQEDVMNQMKERLTAYAAKEGAAGGLTVSHEFCDYFPETRNHEMALEKVKKCAESLSLPCYEMDTLWRASEDFGYYLKDCPGAMFYIGAGTDAPALHTVDYDFADSILETAADMFLALAGVKRDGSL